MFHRGQQCCGCSEVFVIVASLLSPRAVLLLYMQHRFPPYHYSPILLSYPHSGTSQSTNQMLRSLMESQNKVLSVSHCINDLEQLFEAVSSTSTEGNVSSSLNARVSSQFTVQK